MNKTYHSKVIEDVIAKLQELDIDLYLILTSEGCDPMTSFIPGVDTVGYGAFLFYKNGKKIGVTSSIDAQDIIESGLFDEVIKYTNYDNYNKRVAELVITLNPKTIALDYSENDAFCDGLTMGRYEQFIQSLGNFKNFREVSADSFIPKVLEMNPQK